MAPEAQARHPIHTESRKISTTAAEGGSHSDTASCPVLRNEDREQAVARLWKRNRISAGSTVIYLQWVRRFRAYCQRRHLEETSQLTLEGLRGFLHAYVGPRRIGPVAPSTCHVAQNALHAWAWALRALRIPVPEWRPPRAPAKLTPLLAAYCQYRRSLRCSPFFGQKIVLLKVDRCRRACGNCGKAERSLRGLFQASVGIRVLCGFPSEASVSTGLGFSFFFAPFFFLGIFHKKILRQDRLGTTIAPSVDL